MFISNPHFSLKLNTPELINFHLGVSDESRPVRESLTEYLRSE
jgi:hypothetical protein